MFGAQRISLSWSDSLTPRAMACSFPHKPGDAKLDRFFYYFGWGIVCVVQL